MSPGRPIPVAGADGRPLPSSISEKCFVAINGQSQGMFIRSRDARNPVLLYLHGGLPDYFLTQRYPTGLEEYFTMVWWEQRGSGLSYGAATPGGAIGLEQMISDTLAVTEYLRQRFGMDKIYLMGHSGGSYIGILAAAREPELYHAYIGVAQMSNQLESERLAYEYMLGRFRETGNAAMARRLEAAPVTASGVPKAYLAVRDIAMHSLGVGTTRDMDSVVTGIFLPSLSFPGYTLVEKFKLWAGKSRSGVSVLWDSMLSTDLSRKAAELRIPVYFLEGRYDYTCSYSLAKAYFEGLKAPVKGFYTFENSAHSPIFEEPAKVGTIVREDILRQGNSLADPCARED
jgi:pimeloyl-ACP methyl ester carboxylesterase